MLWLRLLAAGLLILLTAAAAAPDDSPRLGDGRVATVLSGDALRLSDGREVRLVGILAPRLARAGPEGSTIPAWPLALAARDALARLVEGKAVRLLRAGATQDRYGRVLAQLVTHDGRWVQEALLRDGWAIFDPHADTPGGLDALRQAETTARNAGRGLWADPFYAVRDPDTVGQAMGRFAVVRGRVISASSNPERVYINFGRDWRQDFTIEIDHHDLASFRHRHIDPVALKGRMVEVRGWVESLNGPMIRVTFPDPLVALEDAAAPPPEPAAVTPR